VRTIDLSALAPMDVAGRLDRLRALLDGAGADALVVTSLTNVRYLTGVRASAAVLIVLDERAVLLTDGRYATQAVEQVEASGVAVDVEIGSSAEQIRMATDLVTGAGVGRLGLEAAHVSWALQQRMVSTWFPATELVATEGLVEELRRVKDRGEQARLALAASIADQALADVRTLLGGGPSEKEFGHALDGRMRELGASGPSFETIVASGPNSAKPHHRPGDRRVRPGEPVVIDFGALVDGYCSDMTRTVWVGELADARLRQAVGVVAGSEAAGVGAVRAGAAARDVDRACREVIAEAGLAELFVHGTGHGVGLDIHEAPSVNASSTDTLAVGQVVTVEPGVYLPGLGGVRIEDTVVVTDDGCQPLTTTPKDLVA
jgi:Xaa-Pro aminopeptidase